MHVLCLIPYIYTIISFSPYNNLWGWSLFVCLFYCIWGSEKSWTKTSHTSTKGYIQGSSQHLGVLRFQPKSCGLSSNYSVAWCGTNTSWTRKSIASFIPPPFIPHSPVFNLLDNNDWISIQHGSQWENNMNKTRLGRMSYDKWGEWSCSPINLTPTSFMLGQKVQL